VTITISTGGGAGGGGGGGGGGGSGGGVVAPTIVLAALLHAGSAPLASLYLSQIPYTGLDLGPTGTMLYWIILIGFAFVATYFILFVAAPQANTMARDFAAEVLDFSRERLAAVQAAPAATMPAAPQPVVRAATLEAPRSNYSTYHGFKSYAKDGALSIDDIVKSLSHAPVASALLAPQAEPIVQVEPIYEHVEPIAPVLKKAPVAESATPDTLTALLVGDRAAVFAGLRQSFQSGGTPESFVTGMLRALDDAYRARVDGVACDERVSRLTARFATPTLEQLVAALATAVDASYSDSVTGAKLALIRALAIVGA